MTLADVAENTVLDHEVHLFVQVDGVEPTVGPSATLRDIPHEVLPNDQTAALSTRYASTAFWKKEESEKRVISPDLHPFIRQLLTGARPELAACWTTTPEAERLFRSADLYENETSPEARKKKLMGLQLTASAKQRLDVAGIQAATLILTIEEARMTAFGTGHAFVDVIVTFRRDDRKPLHVLEINEGIAAIVRFDRVRWIDAQTGEAESEAFSLGTLVRGAVLGSKMERRPYHRIATYTFVELEGLVSQETTTTLATMLSRHYTTDYKISNPASDTVLLHPFVNVTHAVAQEGAVTIIAPTPEEPILPPFIEEGYRKNTFRRAYVPAALLALHEQAFLLNRTTSSTNPLAATTEETLKELRGLIEAALMFRLHYRFTQIGQISMHNAVHRAFRSVFQSEDMLSELTTDVEAVEGYLRETALAVEHAEEHERHRRFYWSGIVGGAALAGLTTYTIVKEVVYLMLDDKTAAGWTGVAFGGVVALVAGCVGYMKRPAGPTHDHHEGHLTQHAMIEHMIKGALK